jgi:hypothetical protein
MLRRVASFVFFDSCIDDHAKLVSSVISHWPKARQLLLLGRFHFSDLAYEFMVFVDSFARI